MNFNRTCSLLAWLVIALLPVSLVAQNDEDLAELVQRVSRAETPAQERIELGTSCLARLKDHPDAKLEQDVRLAMGLAYIEIEQFRLARDQFVAATALARGRDHKDGIAQCLWQSAVMSFYLGDLDVAATAATESLQVAQSIDRNDIAWRAANMLGLTCERQGAYQPALDAFASGLVAAEKIDDKAGAAVLLGNLGMARMNLGEYDAATSIFDRVLVTQRALSDKRGLCSTLANLGDVYCLRQEFDKSYDYHQQALSLRMELGVEAEIARSYHSLGAVKFAQDEHEAALEQFQRSLDIRERLEMAPERAETLMAMAHVYSALDRAEEAGESMQSSSELTEKMAMNGRKLATLEALATVYEERGESAKAIQMLRNAVVVEREQRSRETRRSFAKFEAELGAKDRERRIAVLEKERQIQDLTLRRQSMARNVTLIGAVLFAVLAIGGWMAWAALRRSNRALALVNDQLTQVNTDLVSAAERIRQLEGILPICSFCKDIRDDGGAWHGLESFITSHSQARFTHGICPGCADREYPSLNVRDSKTDDAESA